MPPKNRDEEYKYTIEDATRRQIVDGRIATAEAEHFQHSLNLAIAEAWDEDDPQRDTQMTESQRQITNLERALTVLKREQEKLPAPPMPNDAALQRAARNSALGG